MKTRTQTRSLLAAAILGLTFALTACSETSNSDLSQTPQSEAITSESESENNSNEVINFDPAYTVIDDDNLTMEIISISKDVANEGNDSEFTSYRVNCAITNKSEEYDIDTEVSTTDAYIGSYRVGFSNENMTTKAGKINDSASFTCTVYKNESYTSPDGSEHIESLEDLLQFNATVGIDLFIDTGKAHETHDRYKADISLEDIPADSYQ